MRFAQEGFGGGPVDAFVGDGDPRVEEGGVGLHGLVAALEVAFEHEAADGGLSGFDLGEHVPKHEALAVGSLAGVAVGAVDDDVLRQVGVAEGIHAGGDAAGIVVGGFAAAEIGRASCRERVLVTV